MLASRPPTFLLALTTVLTACSTAVEQGALEGGQASWERPPLDPPGGDGTPSGDTTGGGDSTAGSGTSGASDGGVKFDQGNGTTGGPYTCEPGPTTTGGGSDGSSSSTGATGTTTDATTTTTGASTGATSTSSTTGAPTTCDAQPGICEAASGGDAPCCEDLDCGCATMDCTIQPCDLDGFCDCNCSADPDCTPDACGMPIKKDPAVTAECPADTEPVVLYMSNDDSNSMASPTYARRVIHEGLLVDPFRVRIHEFLNYYDLSYDNPSDKPASVGLQMRRVAADAPEFVLLAYAQGRKMDPANRRPLNLVFSLDTSGSMAGEPIELLKQSMTAIAGSLQEGDIVSVVEWSESQTVPLEAHEVTGPDDPVLLGVVAQITSGGSTDLHGGLIRAYQIANLNYSADRINRVVLMSDGGANTGVTDIDLIAGAAEDSDAEGIYLVGVGVSEAGGYHDTLMDDITDAGKGAYVFIDSGAEAERTFGERFLQTMEVAARNVRLELTMPWYFGIKEFHGEEYSEDPEEIEPQHLAPNDAMSYHQLIAACDGSQVLASDEIRAKATFEDPISREAMSDEITLTIGQLVTQDATQLHKGDVVVAFAQALIVTGDLHAKGLKTAAIDVAKAMVAWLDDAAGALADPEVLEMCDLMQLYVSVLTAHG